MKPMASPVVAWLASACALLAGAVCIWPFYVLAVYSLAWRLLSSSVVPNALRNLVAFPIVFWAFEAARLMGDFGRYVGVSVACILLALAALVFGRRNRALQVLELLTLVGALALPWTFAYQPPLVAAPGCVAYIPTQPDLLRGVVKRAQTVAEITPSTCTVVGWGREGTLYYQEDTTAGASRVWAYKPGADRRPRLVAPPAGLAPATVSPPSAFFALLREPAWPYLPASRSDALRQDGLASPDGRWAAAMVQHTYGPQDIIVVALP